MSLLRKVYYNRWINIDWAEWSYWKIKRPQTQCESWKLYMALGRIRIWFYSK